MIRLDNDCIEGFEVLKYDICCDVAPYKTLIDLNRIEVLVIAAHTFFFFFLTLSYGAFIGLFAASATVLPFCFIFPSDCICNGNLLYLAKVCPFSCNNIHNVAVLFQLLVSSRAGN